MGNDVFVGIDASERGTGLCAIERDRIILVHIPIKNSIKGIGRNLLIQKGSQQLYAMLENEPDLVAYEETLVAGSGRIIQLGQAQMCCRLVLSQGKNTREFGVHVSTLKKFASGLSGCDKDRMIVEAQRLIPSADFPENDDLADAFHLANIARCFQYRTARNRKQAEVLSAVQPCDNLFPESER